MFRKVKQIKKFCKYALFLTLIHHMNISAPKPIK